MGMPFASGHYLALRDMVATSVGPAYRAIWHRDPDGRWTIHTTGAPELTCPRYFGSATATAQVPEHRRVLARRPHPRGDSRRRSELADRAGRDSGDADDDRRWAGCFPRRAGTATPCSPPWGRWRAPCSGPARIRLRGATPNGPRFKAAPLKIWRVVGGAASYRGEDLGEPAPLDDQTRLGDFWLPQRGVFFVGRARFTPAGERVEHPASAAGTRMGR